MNGKKETINIGIKKNIVKCKLYKVLKGGIKIETIKIDKELKRKLDKVSAKAPYLRGKGKIIELDPDNKQHKEWFEDDTN